MKTKIITSVTAIILVCTVLSACASSNHTTGTSSMPTQDSSINVQGFLSTSGQSIINSESGIPVVLRGVNFPSDMTITIEDYKNLDVLNANMVRLALDFSEVSEEEIKVVQRKLNDRPRKALDFYKPDEVINNLVALKV